MANNNYISKINNLKDQYLQMLEINEPDAKANAKYIYKNVEIINEHDEKLSEDTIKPIVIIIERVHNKELADKVITHIEEYGQAPDWLENDDYGFTGEIKPYLSDIKLAEDDRAYFATLEVSGFHNENSEQIFAKTKIVKLLDKGKEKLLK